MQLPVYERRIPVHSFCSHVRWVSTKSQSEPPLYTFGTQVQAPRVV